MISASCVPVAASRRPLSADPVSIVTACVAPAARFASASAATTTATTARARPARRASHRARIARARASAAVEIRARRFGMSRERRGGGARSTVDANLATVRSGCESTFSAAPRRAETREDETTRDDARHSATTTTTT